MKVERNNDDNKDKDNNNKVNKNKNKIKLKKTRIEYKETFLIDSKLHGKWAECCHK